MNPRPLLRALSSMVLVAGVLAASYGRPARAEADADEAVTIERAYRYRHRGPWVFANLDPDVAAVLKSTRGLVAVIVTKRSKTVDDLLSMPHLVLLDERGATDNIAFLDLDAENRQTTHIDARDTWWEARRHGRPDDRLPTPHVSRHIYFFEANPAASSVKIADRWREYEAPLVPRGPSVRPAAEQGVAVHEVFNLGPVPGSDRERYALLIELTHFRAASMMMNHDLYLDDGSSARRHTRVTVDKRLRVITPPKSREKLRRRLVVDFFDVPRGRIPKSLGYARLDRPQMRELSSADREALLAAATAAFGNAEIDP